LQKPEHAFIFWYAISRFGTKKGVELLDRKLDGGLDALLELPEETYFFQSKYEVVPRVGHVLRSEVSALQNLARKFKDPSLRTEFERWLETVTTTLRPKYERIYKRASIDPNSVRFIFITTKQSSYKSDDFYEIEDINRIAPLWYLYSEGFTPPTEKIDLTLDKAAHTDSAAYGYRTYIGIGDIREFLKLMRDDANERLFAQNVRTNLRSAVNSDIRETYEKEPDIFWLFNNGIYVVCKKVIAVGDTHTLTFPSVINGSQTLHAIAESKKRHACKILVRILEMDVIGKPALLSDVVKRTNTQNAMRLTNLFAHDPLQLHVAMFLNGYNVFYERREREWQNEKKDILFRILSC